MSSQMWDARYGNNDYAYGTAPNDFLRSEAEGIPTGRVLCVAEGEGRNAVFLASLGHAVTAVDFSAAGLRKAGRLAAERGVTLDLVEADLAAYSPEEDAYAGAVSIFAHLPADVRRRLNGLLVRALMPGGCLILEGYAPKQIGFGTGGPKDPALLASIDELKAELRGLDFTIAREVEREVKEGTFHTGQAATVQIMAYRRT